jgi:TRAP-type C4-dicarboxylate transport system substrate-binding protein
MMGLTLGSSRMSNRISILISIALSAALLAACGNSSDRTGRPTTGKPVTLTFANGNGTTPDVQPFADAVARLSGGHIRIKFRSDWGRGRRDYEQRLIRDVAAGKVDLGWTGARAFDALGDRSFDALIAPLLIDSYPLEQKVVTGTAARSLLDTLKPLGLTGIGLLPGPMRTPIAVKHPLLSPADFRGLRMGYQGGPGLAANLSALGASPVRLPTGAEWRGFDALEQHISSDAGNKYEHDAHYVSANVNLWPRVPVIFAGPSATKRLSGSQLALLRRAAVEAVPAAMASLRDAERAALKPLCAGGIHFVLASATQLNALRAALRPRYDAIARDPNAAKVLDAIRSARGSNAPAPEALPPCPKPAPPAASGPIPDGKYRGHVDAGLGNTEGPMRLELSHDSYVLWTPNKAGRLGVGAEGIFETFRDHVTITITGQYSLHGTWSLHGDALRIRINDGEPGDRHVWNRHPFARVR